MRCVCLCRREQGEESGSGSGGQRGGYQAFSSMVFAQGGVPQQHVTANEMPSPESDVQRNDLAPDASLSLTNEDEGGGMGSLTGWQALANEVILNTCTSANTPADAVEQRPIHAVLSCGCDSS